MSLPKGVYSTAAGSTVKLSGRHGDAAGLSAASFRARGWIVDSGDRDGRMYVYAPGDAPTPEQLWPEIAAAIEGIPP